ncbi:hypothetical protein GQ457_11G000120 [Hibiscus cannabinus]
MEATVVDALSKILKARFAIPDQAPSLITTLPSISVPARLPASGIKSTFSTANNLNTSVTSRSTTPSVPSLSSSKTTLPGNARGAGKMLSAVENEERRKKRLCFWCSSKYVPSHRCARMQLYQIMVEGTKEEVEADIFLECEENGEMGVIVQEGLKNEGPVLSLQAMWGVTACETMKVKVVIGGSILIALVDTGSTHNFMSSAAVKNLGWEVDEKCNMKVTVTDGSSFERVGWCRGVNWKAQENSFATKFLVLPFKGGDMLEFKKESSPIPEVLQSLLLEYEDVFEEPQGLPPERGQDHRITLVDEKAVIDYLGYVISEDKIAMDQSKVSCILDWPAPSSIKELRGFLGLSGYYRRFIRGYGIIAKPLIDLLKNGGWKWTQEEEETLEKLKQSVSSAPILALPDYSLEFIVETDASEMGVGAILIQNGKPLAFFSKGLGSKQHALSVYEKEMLAVLMVVKKWFQKEASLCSSAICPCLVKYAGEFGIVLGLGGKCDSRFPQNQHVTKADYDETGPCVVHRKCF